MTEHNKTDAADVADALVVLGLMLVGAAVWMLWGGAAVAAYVGTLLIVFGIMMAMQRGRKPQQ